MPYHTVSAADWPEFKRLYVEEELSCREIARRTHWTEGTVRHALEKMGVPRRDRWVMSAKVRRANPVGAEKHAEEIVRMYTVELATVKDICREFGFTETPIRNVLRKRGIKFEYRAPKRFDWEEWQETERLYLSGLSCTAVGKIQGIHRTTVQDRLAYLETPMRPKKPTHCKRGHQMTQENTMYSAATPSTRAKRTCRACHNARQRGYAQRLVEQNNQDDDK